MGLESAQTDLSPARGQSARGSWPGLRATLHLHTLSWALGFSLLVHVALIAWRFTDPLSFNRVFEDTPLEVVLVNARSETPPERAQALAQVHLAGGGVGPNGQRATSPLPPSAASEVGMDIGAMQRQIDALGQQQLRLLTQLQQELSALTQEPDGTHLDAPERQARQERQQQLRRALAQIEPSVAKTQGGPRQRFIGPATQEAVYALYYDQLRRTIETRGTLNFPQVGGQKLYGQLTMVITVNDRGRLVRTEVARPSGQPLLDQRAQAIVRSAAPFEAFSANMRRQADQIVVVTRFQFSQEGTLDMRMLSPDTQQP